MNTPAIAYYRMSSDMQAESIDRQRAEIALLIKTGQYDVVRDYEDRGKSGSRFQHKRAGLHSMIADIESGAVVPEVLLLWDTARLTRENPFRAAKLYELLRERGIKIHSVKNGFIDLNTQQGRIVVNLIQELNHQDSESISSNSTSGRRNVLQAGWWAVGEAPYGYDRLFCGPEGQEIFAGRNDTSIKKPRGWHTALVENADEGAEVRRMFQKYLEEDTSLRQVARDLNERGVLSPSGDPAKAWKNDVVKGILTKKAYCGYATVGHRGRSDQKEAFNRIGDDAIKSDKVPALVDEADFQQVQKKLKRRKERRQNVKPSQAGKLSGLLYCGQCKTTLDKKQRTNSRGEEYVYYTCTHAVTYPGRSNCHQWKVNEADILSFVLSRLVGEIDRKVISTILDDPMPQEDRTEERLRLRLAALENRVGQASSRYLSAPAEIVPELGKQLQKLTDERDSVEEQLRQAEAREPNTTLQDWLKARQVVEMFSVEVPGFDEMWAKADKNARSRGQFIYDPTCLYRLEATFKERPERLRALLKEMEFAVTVFWKAMTHTATGKPRKGKRTFWEVDWGQVTAEITLHNLTNGSSTSTRAGSLGKD
jgi:DNA invertase Pin-like site-specific DNA recombinase